MRFTSLCLIAVLLCAVELTSSAIIPIRPSNANSTNLTNSSRAVNVTSRNNTNVSSGDGDDSQDPFSNVVSQGSGSRTVVVKNNCPYTIWPGVLHPTAGGLNAGFPLPYNGGWQQVPGQSVSFTVPWNWVSGRVWARTGCKFDGNGNGACESADCGNRLQCNGAGGATPASLAEFTFAGSGNQDFYDVSLVDGYNLPVRITSTNLQGCGQSVCTKDLNSVCPGELQKKNAAGKVIGCLSACEKFGTDDYCCRGTRPTPQLCPPTRYSKIFKDSCPQAYSYAYDDATSTFLCDSGKKVVYTIQFC